MFSSSIGTVSAPVMGVQTPTSKRIAAIAVSIAITAGCSECPVGSVTFTWYTRATAMTRRNNKSPAPGQPWANVENSRLKRSYRTERPTRDGTTKDGMFENGRNSPGIGKSAHSLEWLQFDDASLQCYRDRLSAIIGAQFWKDVLNSALDRLFTDRKLSGNLLICIPFSDQA